MKKPTIDDKTLKCCANCLWSDFVGWRWVCLYHWFNKENGFEILLNNPFRDLRCNNFNNENNHVQQKENQGT